MSCSIAQHPSGGLQVGARAAQPCPPCLCHCCRRPGLSCGELVLVMLELVMLEHHCRKRCLGRGGWDPAAHLQVTFHLAGGGEAAEVGPWTSREQAKLVCNALTGE